ncbi:unnamed protein product [Blepharisma stoltei]|uniref:RNA helicase n=1 Tax=Blepharisma stoltei TaxID=1481888 RepID=A0AAU9J4P0_9CILI|nr:unnamed protein product [Blepharisma stoltei]
MLKIMRLARYFSAIPESTIKTASSFEQFNLPKYILDVFKEAGYTEPTPIQAMTWPIIMKGKDLVGIAKTGSGKTMGFLVPSLLHIKSKPPVQRGDGPRVLVLSPTRELACQIGAECELFEQKSQTTSVCVYGGANKWLQARKLRLNPETIIATPGRLIDFIDSKETTVKNVSYLVLDEADRMLDMGFEPQIREILKTIRADHQTLMFTATWPKEIIGLARDFLSTPEEIRIGSEDLTANPDIEQTFEFIHSESEKFSKLLEVCHHHKNEKILIFCDTKMECQRVADKLKHRSIKAEELHGDKEQYDRDLVMKSYKKGEIDIVVATDVASRGLDVKDIKLVINYSMPRETVSYVHRIGRTGRAGAKGKALTFYSIENPKIAKELIKILQTAGQPVPPELKDYAGGSSPSSFSRSSTSSSNLKRSRSADFSDEDSGRKSSRSRFSEEPIKRRAAKPQLDEEGEGEEEETRKPKISRANFDEDEFEERKPRRTRSRLSLNEEEDTQIGQESSTKKRVSSYRRREDEDE